MSNTTFERYNVLTFERYRGGGPDPYDSHIKRLEFRQPPMVREQVLEFGNIRMTSVDNEEVLYFLAGKRLYEIGWMSGEYPRLGWRRVGPVVGKRITEAGVERPSVPAHLNEMGGIWAQPIRLLESLHFTLSDGVDTRTLRQSRKFVHRMSHAEFHFEHDGISVVRTDFVVEDAPALFVWLRIKNNREHSARLSLCLHISVHMIASWFSGWREGEAILQYSDGRVFAYDSMHKDNWAVMVGADAWPESHQFGKSVDYGGCTLSYALNLSPGEEIERTFLIVGESREGHAAARKRFDELIGRREELLASKMAYYQETVFGGVQFDCSDPWFNQSFYLAKANLVLLTADLSPDPGRYLYAGIPEYVQFFGCDTTYSIPGLLVVGYWDIARDALLGLAGAARRQCGRIPHEITTNGRIFHPGNTQETPQFTSACWNYCKYTGDRAFLEEVYPLCREGVRFYVLAQWDTDLDYYPDGNSMIERHGMGSEKLDTICYFTRALYDLASMAGALHRPDDRDDNLHLADLLKDAINADWWIERRGLYADSLRENHAKKLDGHWTVVVPLETGLAPWKRAQRSLRSIERTWVSQQGMVHTRNRELEVWTLPTGLLAVTEFRYGHPDHALRLLYNITETTRHDMLGAYEELIPKGLSFLQLWSPAIFLQGLIEGLFGLEPRADEDLLELFPQLPTKWTHARLSNLRIGEHVISVLCERAEGEETTAVESLEGRGKLSIRLKVGVKGSPVVSAPNRDVFAYVFTRRGDQGILEVTFELERHQRVRVTSRGNAVVLELTPL